MVTTKSSKKGLVLISILLIVVLSFALTGCGQKPAEDTKKDTKSASQPAKVYQLKCNMVLGPGTGIWKAGTEWAKRVKEASNGQLDISLHTPGSLIGTTEALEALGKGVIQLNFSTGEYWAGKDPAYAFVTYLPCGFESPEQHDFWLYKRGGIELIRELYAKSNVYLLSLPYYPPEYLMSRVPIQSLADIKGKKLVFSGSMPHALFTKLGASTVFMPTAERVTALERGVIDGGDIGIPSTTTAIGADRVAKYMLRPSFHQPSSALELAINMDLWKSLPDNLKKILELESYELAWRCYRESLDLDFEALKKMRAGGLKEYKLQESEVKQLRKMALEIWNEEAKKTELGKKILDSQVAVMKELGLLD